MRKISFIVALIILPVSILGLHQAQSAETETLAGDKKPVVLELFTSQSCSSCPPADKLLGKLAAENDAIIALSCNVTYWNHLHWKDTLSKQFCTERQRQYVQTLKSRGPYTPQIIVNGRHEMVGSRNADIRRAIAGDLKKNVVQPITLNLSDNILEMTLPDINEGVYTLLLMAHGGEYHQEIPSGENRGKAVSYTNPIQEIISLGTWDGKAKTLTHDISGLNEAKGYVVLVQKDGVTGPILAAAQVMHR